MPACVIILISKTIRGLRSVSVLRQARRRSTPIASVAFGSVQLSPFGRADARGVTVGSWPDAWAPDRSPLEGEGL